MFGEFIVRTLPFLRYFSTKSIIPHQHLGRWRLNDNIQRKIDLANIDNCGDRLCGIPISKELKDTIKHFDERWDKNYNNKNYNNINILVNDYNIRYNDNLTKEEFRKKFTRFKI